MGSRVRSKILAQLERATHLLISYGPYSTAATFRQYQAGLDQLGDVRAFLEVIDRHRPLVLDTLAEDSFERERSEADVGEFPELDDLIERYSGRVKP